MQAPPFKLATAPGHDGRSGYRPLADLCCAQSDKATQRQTEVPREVPRRARLIDLDPIFHCSVIGTCLSTGELRKLVPRLTDLDRERASDLDIHHAAVQLAGEEGWARSALNKALEAQLRKHAQAIQQRENRCRVARPLAPGAEKRGSARSLLGGHDAPSHDARTAPTPRLAKCICCRIWLVRPIGPISVDWSHWSRKIAN